jgi:hypothetical protein
MSTIIIDEKGFEELLFRLEMFVGKVEMLCEQLKTNELKKWYDNQDVCLKLNISLRTLQTMRSNGTLPYTQINRKMFYRPQDVEKLIVNQIKSKSNE